MSYTTPSISDYGDVRDITAQRFLRSKPDAEFPGEVPGGPAGTLDDTTGPCITGQSTPSCLPGNGGF
jgi:hypothetical protein